MEFELENLFADETLWDSQENDEAILSRFNELQFNGIDFTRAKDQVLQNFVTIRASRLNLQLGLEHSFAPGCYVE
jgi:hypothetical protein